MGKDLKGKELGVGISQLKDGRYTARFTTKSGKRVQGYFKKLQECRKWIADTQFQDENGDVLFTKSPITDAWFYFWLNEIKGNGIRETTKHTYTKYWKNNISPFIGKEKLSDIKPVHCQKILNQLSETHKLTTIKSYRFLMWSVFESAVENGFIDKNPVSKSVKAIGGEKSEKKEALTIDEQKAFLCEAENSCYYNGYALVLQTGLRVGELIALKWSDIDFKNRKIYIKRSASELSKEGFIIGDPKTKSGTREIPLTEEAIKIFQRQREKNSQNKVVSIEYADFVFLNSHGKLIQKAAYNQGIYAVCDRAGIRHFSMHLLRHTFATRCIEGGMRPKTLQEILGHSTIEMTMNLYVHVTDEAKYKEMEKVEQSLKLV